MNNIPIVLVGPLSDNYGMPSLAVSLLKMSLKERGINSKVVYANMLFYEIVGMQLYEELFSGDINNLLYERLFAPLAYDEIEKTDMRGFNGDEISEQLREFYCVIGDINKNISQLKYSDMEARCELFIEKMVERIVPFQPRIIGFSNSYQQTNPSTALAKALKQALPKVLCVIGGNNCEGTMGEEIAASLGVFDYVFQGEADFAFADFCYDYIENKTLPKNKLIHCSPIRNLDAVLVPNYDDFFEQCDIDEESVVLSFESSRGCWWGVKNQCKFCGESALSTGYRSKSPERMFKELSQLQDRYLKVRTFLATDSILPYNYLKDFLPLLKSTDFRRKLIYETKANLTYEQIIQMRRAGIFRIMPGIESLSRRLLILLNKGTNPLINIRLLRNCRELDIQVAWLLLVGIPGDRASHYEEQLELMPLIQHLSPPRMIPIRIQRFSPYFRDAKNHRIKEIKPAKAYEYAFPDSVNIARLAYYFAAQYPSESRERPDILVPLKQQLDRWNERWMQKPIPKLSMQQKHSSQWKVEDTRDCAKVATQMLTDEDHSLLKQCRTGISPNRTRSKGRIDLLLDLGYLIEVDGKLLSIVCESSPPEAT
ncbi:MAG: RiPP maturation radical SAM C-methyltransferase [Thermodesulfobacteriota bacterium]|nr:RiPP maturation radical SAM C-methyltransferase [Thermodesulfobacteriota bacterium]